VIVTKRGNTQDKVMHAGTETQPLHPLLCTAKSHGTPKEWTIRDQPAHAHDDLTQSTERNGRLRNGRLHLELTACAAPTLLPWLFAACVELDCMKQGNPQVTDEPVDGLGL